MRVVRYREYGGPEVLVAERSEVPVPAPGEVLIRAEVIGVNFIETQRRRGQAPIPSPLPGAPAGDVVGIVEALGDGVSGLAAGDRVAAAVFHDAYADFVTAEAGWLVPLPAGLDPLAASVLASPAQTAWTVVRTARIEAGETVLVHAAAGTIGHLAVQLARLAGAGTIVATASSPAKLDFAREYGADITIDYSRATWPAEARDSVGEVDVILDSVGGETTHRGIGLLAPFGRLVSFGSAGGGPEMPVVSTMDLMGMKYVTGSSLAEWRLRRPDQVRAGLAELIDHLDHGRLRVGIHAALPLAEAARAHQIIEDRTQLGRVVLLP
ncbi:quinone oxidoreductase family protein [Actinoallomurus acaciae]|uniref:Zinc-binding alcohol dehydrogenase family protein n=1 Tax=Actinoallomurus acaciae TaxID=502577 RepID=A0ABV5YBU4_9ACTN